ncbi:MAG: hypothetical protein ASARMPRED_008439 [Alectoria sarmentosa]|nr:MAG: hypothetical protein ASARMPRED_008439 [Alectoria sarmentosa]
MQRRMVRIAFRIREANYEILTDSELSKEDEAAVGKDELEVRREDQDKINKFSRLHQRETTLEDELKTKAKDKEDLEELSNELELADEDDKIPYKIGDTFVSLPLPEVQEMLAASTEKIEEVVSAVERKLSVVREEMEQLKVQFQGLQCLNHDVAVSSDTHGEEKGLERSLDQSENIGRDGNRTNEPPAPFAGDTRKIDHGIKIEKENLHGKPNHDERIIVSFPDGDPENPYNWRMRKKVYILLAGIVAVINSTLGSSLPSNAINYIAPYFHVTNEQQLVLPISLFLVGYVLGPIGFGPLSETYGRKVIMLSSFVVFTLFTMACALAPNWPAFLVFRLICGINASSAIAVVGGLYADVFGNPVIRGRAMAIFMAATTCGPMLAPLISGFVSVVSWRWTFWVGLIVAGASLIFLCFLPETYGPIILKKRARRMRKESANPNIFAAIELEKKGARQMMTVTLMRPVHMIVYESIVLFTCLYLSVAYAIFYLFFEAYPIIFEGLYHMNTGVAGLAFLPILIGAVIALGIFIWYDAILQRAKKANVDWAFIEEYRRLPLACLGGPLYVISLFWLGWSASPHVHWIVPMLAGVPFGMGFMLIFMALLNYVTDAYEVYAASGMAATSCCRSIFGAVLPLAATPMYKSLGVSWASSLLGFLSLAMSIIPFAFIKYGDRIRENSKFCQELKKRKEEITLEKKKERDESVGKRHAAKLEELEFGEKE